MNNKPPSNSNKRFLMRYLTLGSQLIAAIGIAVFLGYMGDKWLKTSPLLICVLPLLTLSGIFYKIYRETNRRNKDGT